MGSQLGAARLLYGMGRSNGIPKKFFGAVDPKSHVPRNNVIFVGVIALAGSFIITYDQGADLLNFGALLAFMGVNIAALVRYYFRAEKKNILNLISPLLGFLICAFIWSHLSGPALKLGRHLDGHRHRLWRRQNPRLPGRPGQFRYSRRRILIPRANSASNPALRDRFPPPLRLDFLRPLNLSARTDDCLDKGLRRKRLPRPFTRDTFPRPASRNGQFHIQVTQTHGSLAPTVLLIIADAARRGRYPPKARRGPQQLRSKFTPSRLSPMLFRQSPQDSFDIFLARSRRFGFRRHARIAEPYRRRQRFSRLSPSAVFMIEVASPGSRPRRSRRLHRQEPHECSRVRARAVLRDRTPRCPQADRFAICRFARPGRIAKSARSLRTEFFACSASP